ncbi:MAG: sugar transferase, partial [Terriglobales bacterium]
SLLCAAVALALAWPLMLLVALAIRLESPGPVIFRQKRIGRGGRAFTLYKFRSMWTDADHGGAPRPVQIGDPRITRVGRWIRRCRLDELPQLWNIARGDLHIVGPRPFVPEQELELAEQIPFYRLRWGVQPGATGWAQVQHGYCATREDNAEKLAFDLFYIKHQSLGLDLFIVLQTFKILLLGRGAR